MRQVRPKPTTSAVVPKHIHLLALGCALLTALAWLLLPSQSRGHVISPPADGGHQPAQEARLLTLPLPAPVTGRQAETTLSTMSPSAESGWRSHRIEPGDTLAVLFPDLGLEVDELYRLLAAEGAREVLERIRPGQVLKVRARVGQLQELLLLDDPLTGRRFVSQGDDFREADYQPRLDTHTAWRAGVVEGSLYRSAQAAGLSARMIAQMIEVFEWDIDFADVQPGDRFAVAFEEHFQQGQKVGEGVLLAAAFIHDGHTFEAVRYTDATGQSGYYRPDGQGLRQAFLKSPVDFRRISSDFQPRRKHPVLGVVRAHEGIDYAAATGTPIRATGEAEVAFAGLRGGYGKAVILRHEGGYTTLYAHMSRIASNLRRGRRVKQGEIIGYVGQTGLVTGPHLHYELHIDGQPVDPLRVNIPGTERIPPAERKAFQRHSRTLLAGLERSPRLWPALADQHQPAGRGQVSSRPSGET